MAAAASTGVGDGAVVLLVVLVLLMVLVSRVPLGGTPLVEGSADLAWEAAAC
ncbi:MAG: hypothetical protein ACRD1K_16765 [Acidimicrobiales bacterium]